VGALRGGDQVEHGALVAGAQQLDRVGWAVDIDSLSMIARASRLS